jgi:hypothetical protein
MSDTSITMSVNVHNTPSKIWDALARVCDVQEGANNTAWVAFTAPSGAQIHFFRTKPERPA